MKKIIVSFAFLTVTVFCLTLAHGEEKSEMAELLFVQNAHDVSLDK